MSEGAAKAFGGVAFLVGLSLGVVPLVQWFVFGRASGPIGIVFRHPAEPWVWIWPASICIMSFACMWYSGTVEGKK